MYKTAPVISLPILFDLIGGSIYGNKSLVSGTWKSGEKSIPSL